MGATILPPDACRGRGRAPPKRLKLGAHAAESTGMAARFGWPKSGADSGMATTSLRRVRSPCLVLCCVLATLPNGAAAAPIDGAAEPAMLLARNAISTVPAGLPGLDTQLQGDEVVLRHALLQATWPADIARLADDYLRLHGQQAWATEAALLLRRASLSAALLRRNDVPLFRAAFAAPAAGDDGASADLRQAALGDAAAAWRQAGRSATLAAAAGNLHRQIGWLHYAAALGSEQAAYALALHYRRTAQPLLAAQFETRAAALGHVMPTALAHTRK